jgi:copper chaperone CopZ
MIKKKFHIPDMHCSNCSMRLQELEELLTGVKSVSASYHKQQMVVEYDETIVNEAEIVAATKKLGYTAEPLE